MPPPLIPPPPRLMPPRLLAERSIPGLRDPLKVLFRLALLPALGLALGFERGLRLAAVVELAAGRC